MILLRVDTSIRAADSTSRALADSAQQAWLSEHPQGSVVRRDLGLDPISVQSWIAANDARWVPAEQRTPEQSEAVTLAETLRDEVLAADAYLFAVPLYNFGVPITMKAWIDILLTVPELGAGGDAPLTGRPAVLVIARGGGYGPGTPREGWDHSTPWLERIFTDVFKLDLRTVAAELTLAKVVPAMAGLIDVADASLAQAHDGAQQHGREVARLAAKATTNAA